MSQVPACRSCRNSPREACKSSCCGSIYCQVCLQGIMTKKYNFLQCKKIVFRSIPNEPLRLLIDGNESAQIEVTLVTLSNERHSLQVSPDINVEWLKSKIDVTLGTNKNSYSLLGEGKLMPNGITLREWGVTDNGLSLIHI